MEGWGPLMWILAKIKGYLMALSLLLGVIAFAFLRGRQSAKFEQEKQRLEDYVDTRKTIDLAEDSIADAGGGREWLLQRRREHGGSM